MDVDTSNSTTMYLSFDAESINASAMFKTLEASSMDIDTVDKAIEASQNNTLEAKVNETDFHPNLVRSMQLPNAAPTSKTSIYKDYKALCSTPSKEQMRNVVVTRGSASKRYAEPNTLCLTDIQEEAMSLPVEENKENALPESSEGSMSSLAENATTVIERKLLTLSISNDGEKAKQEPAVATTNAVPRYRVAVNTVKTVNSAASGIAAPKEAPTAKAVSVQKRRTLQAPKNHRASLCEPDLNANKPSRILASHNRRPSLAAAATGAEAKNKESEIPTLLKRMTKLGIVPHKDTKPAADTATASSSKLPRKLPSQSEKRPYSISQRMSVTVKTTLNSPARKMLRRSGTNQRPSRKSIHSKTDDAAEDSAANAINHSPPTKIRKFLLPTAKLVKENASTNTQKYVAARRSLYTMTRSSIAPKLTQPAVGTLKPSKPEMSFVCTICSTRFAFKSLLAAHKRKHEESLPPMARRASIMNPAPASAAPTLHGEQKCKYCDKKFALLRALHIHLLQNCGKIPPMEKRKLEYTELNHVEKAQLPTIFHQNASHDQSGSTASAAAVKPAASRMPAKSHSNLSSAPASSAESLLDRQKDITDMADQLVAAVNGIAKKMEPPVSTTVKKKPAHAGVYRTPSKCVPCYLCKRSFKSVIEYTDHAMTMHSTAGNADDETR